MTDHELQAIGEKIRALMLKQRELAYDSDAYNEINFEIASLVSLTDGKAQQFVDAYEQVIH